MAQRKTIIFVDDLDGTDIPRGLGDTVRFGIDGRNYEIDLTDAHASELREVLTLYVEAGRQSVTIGSRRRKHK